MMNNLLSIIIPVLVRVSFWSAVIWTFFPVLTLIVSALMTSLNGTVLLDLFYMIQMFLPFNFNVVLLWSLSAGLAFCTWWVAEMLYGYLNKLFTPKVQF